MSGPTPTISSPSTISPATSQFRSFVLPVLLAGLVFAHLAACSQAPPLPALGADLSQTSVSGVSSGAYMAGQFHIAHSKTIIGAGIVAGGPYGCAESVFGGLSPLWPATLTQNVNRALNGCMKTNMSVFGVPNIVRLKERAEARAADDKIDALEGLQTDRVYLFSGLKDRTVDPRHVRDAARLYQALGVPKENITLVRNDDAGHGFVTEDQGVACGATETPYLNDCDYDQAGAILNHIYGKLAPPSEEKKGELMLFSQSEFETGSGTSLGDTGAIFVPGDCVKESGCRVHVVFHGCRQGRDAIGDKFIEGAGFNRWAAANRIIVLYPQVTDSTVNPRGCWDWWGYTGPEFLTRDAPQIKAVQAMLARLAEQPKR